MLSMFLVLTLGFAVAEAQGSIWTTTSACGEIQNDNHYAVGEDVYIRGNNFGASTYAWDITGQPGQASCDPNVPVASGNLVVDNSGAFCFKAYTVLEGDCGEYKANFDNKHDNYRVEENNVVPEFKTTIGILTTLGALGVFFLVRRK